MENSTMKTGNPVANEEDFQKVANKVSTITIIGNIALSLLKLFAGIVAHSNAMISDAIHSASDVFSTFVVIIGIRLASKKPDKEHPYGHERLECVAAIVLAIVLLITGLGIGIEAFKTILQGNSDNIQTPGILALIAAIISIVSKEAMYWYTRYHAKRIDSSALMADAWHHRSDAFSSIGALVGIAGSRLGFPIMDSIASLVIFVFIVKAASDIFKDAIDKMVDHSCDEEMETQLRNCVMRNPNVHKIDVLATRVEQYRADEETVRNALLASQKVADACIREAKEKAAKIVRDAETKAQTLLVDANNMTAAEKEHYLQLQSDAANLRNELISLYSKHIKSIDDLPSTSDVEASKAELDEKYPTEDVTAPAQPQVEDDVKIAVPSEMKAEPIAETEEVSAHPKRQSKFSHLKFGDNYDVTAD